MKHAGGFRILNYVRRKSTKQVVLILLLVYLALNTTFGIVYYWLDRSALFYSTTDELKIQNSTTESLLTTKEHSFGDCIYFSFVTASTIGYGDIYTNTGVGKTVVTIQSVMCALYTAVMMSVITSKLLWPKTETIVFSNSIILDPIQKVFHVRIINTNSMPIINPDIKITLTVHAIGDENAGIVRLNNQFAQLAYLGRHDYTISFGLQRQSTEIEAREFYLVLNELLKAREYEKDGINKSRFRILITISGSNGVQSVAEFKKYMAKDFVIGSGFSPIKYNGNDDNEFGIVYDRIENFWEQFEMVENEQTFGNWSGQMKKKSEANVNH